MLRDKCILLISPDPWHGLRMSKHHWAEALARRGNQVLWLDAPRPGFGPITLEHDTPVERVGYHHWFRGINRMPTAVQRWYHQCLLKNVEKKAGRTIDIVWSFDASRFQHLPLTGPLRIVHLVDLDEITQGKDMLQEARLLLTVSAELQKAMQGTGPRAVTLNIGHGLDARWLRGSGESERRPGVRPVVACSGNMAIKYLDWEVLLCEVSAHPGADFRFIGPCVPEPDDPAYVQLRQRPNVTFTGLLDKQSLIGELRKADVLLLCYRADRWPTDLSNSHKMLEYLSTGKPIIASRTAEYASVPDPVIRMAEERWMHPALLAEVLADPERYDTDALRSARQRIAAAHTVEAQLHQVENAIAVS